VLHVDAAAGIFEQSPSGRKFVDLDESGLGEVETLAADAFFRLAAKRLVAVNEKVGARDFAFDDYGMAGLFPSDGVGGFAADADLFGEDDAAAVGAKPANGSVDELVVGHENFSCGGMSVVLRAGSVGK
jgi:hypothetical protein